MVKKVILAGLALGWVLASSPARAQSINTVHVYTEPAGLVFYVDGQGFTNSADFSWPATSKHDINSVDQDNGSVYGGKFAYQGWTTNLGSGLGPITADPSLQWVKLRFGARYRLTINLISCPDPKQVCPSPGRVEVSGTPYEQFAQIYLPAGGTVEAKAFPNSGYIFTGWGQVPGLGRPTAFIINFVMPAGPAQLAPEFQVANAAKVDANLQTIPPNLRLLVDRTSYGPPINLEWGWGTVHSLGTDRVQVENGTTYVFDSWSDGGAINHDIQVPNQSGPLNFTAKFVPAVFGIFSTSPPGLKLSIDGAPNFPESGFAWAPGTVHKISAPATQTDAQGRKYRFVSWSNGKPAAFDYTVGTTDERLTASYQAVGLATLTTVPEGLPLLVDGASCTTPCAIEKDPGATVSVAAASMRNINDGARLLFQGWGDSSDTTRVIAVSADPMKYTATYTTQNRLLVSATPPEGASFRIAPSSPDGFYDSGTLVSIDARLELGFKAMGWSGDFSGAATTASVMLDSPRSGNLRLDRVPAIAPLGVRNAAAGASPDSVAPGSVISIFGGSLAPDLRVGPSSPLAQTLGSVTVRVDGTFLPLIFISPGQINAQLPSILPEGPHQIIVRWEGKPETSAKIVVTRNAPGLFNSGPADTPLGSFLRGNDAITPDNPAHAGDTVSILGTGLGAYVQAPPDGFLFDESAGYTLVDDVTVVMGDGSSTASPLYAGRSGVAVGVDSVRFQLPANLPDAPYLPLKIRINGQESNTVLLPISH